LIVYIESNFVLEIALEQEGRDDARALLVAGRRDGVELAIPTFSLSEPYSTVTNRLRGERQDFRRAQERLRQRQREGGRQAEAEQLSAGLEVMVDIGRRDMEGIDRIVAELLVDARVLEFTAEVHTRSLAYQDRYGFDASDSIVYATIVTDAMRCGATEPKLFVTRNERDFDLPEVRTELEALGCDLYLDFASAREALEAMP
jgi:predicted nucleic acid-binding protein